MKLEKWREAEEQPGREFFALFCSGSSFVPKYGVRNQVLRLEPRHLVLLQAVCNAILRASPDNEKEPPQASQILNAGDGLWRHFSDEPKHFWPRVMRQGQRLICAECWRRAGSVGARARKLNRCAGQLRQCRSKAAAAEGTRMSDLPIEFVQNSTSEGPPARQRNGEGEESLCKDAAMRDGRVTIVLVPTLAPDIV